jgi:subtilisin-like proprotein convertase family protein
MRKRVSEIYNGGHSDVELHGVDQNYFVVTSSGARPDHGPQLAADFHSDAGHSRSDDSFGNSPDAAAAGGKKGGAGGSTSGGGTTGGGGTTSVGGTTGTVTGQGTTTAVFHDIPIHWQTLDPPTGDTTLPIDTLFSKQWNLTSSISGINISKAWQNYTGAGVKIGIVDDGIDYNHPDLNPHYLFNLDYNAVVADNNAYGSSTDRHGTTVAGIAAASREGSGIVGVAYDAAIAGFRISYSTSSPSTLADALNHLVTGGMDVANASWGYSTAFQDNFESNFSSSRTAIENVVSNGRGGLGINLVFAAGNNRSAGDNVSYHNYQNSPYVITVAATDNIGWHTPVSNPGAALLVSAPGTSLMTDDRVGSAGYSSGDYTSSAGTSYAAPMVSGVVALMLQANPDLGYRDVQEILAYSAKQTDLTNPGWLTNGAHNWNGGGLHFSHDYGFGLVDATAAVRLAESWQTQSTFANMSTESATHIDNAKIPDGTGSLQSTINFGLSLLLDKVVVDLNITHPRVSDLTVTLTSPDGTTATLVAHPASGTGSGIVFETSANNFWGEDARGNWTLTVTDNVSGSVGTLNSWTLQALGDAPDTPTTYVYTNEFATAAGADRAVLHDTSGAAGINTAAVTTDCYLDLHAGALDTIAGRTVMIAADTILKFAWAGDGNDTIIANDAGNIIQGGRGNDRIVDGLGADTFYGGPGSDSFVFLSMGTALNVIGDFIAGQDTIDLHQLLTAVGYNGTDPIADNWISLVADGTGGTTVMVDAHNGLAAVAIVDIRGVTPTALHEGTSYWTLAA